MRQIPLLPIAPRPYAGELISSWQGRVACRYGCTREEIDRWLGCDGANGEMNSFVRHDVRPSTSIIKSWARASRLRVCDIERMALGRLARPASWYVDGYRERGLCTQCLDEDVSEGQDHHLRAEWFHVEAVVCAKHRRRLQDFCDRCFARGQFRFEWQQGRAVLVCERCSSPVSTIVNETMEPDVLDFLILLTRTLEDVVARRHVISLQDIIAVAKFLWTPCLADGKPFIAWFDLGQTFTVCPLSVGFSGSLANLARPPRVATLIATAQLLDLVQARQLFGEVPAFIERELAQYSCGPASSTAAAPRSKKKVSTFKLRRDAEYYRMARQTIATQDWRNIAKMKDRVRNRHLGRLMNEALNRE